MGIIASAHGPLKEGNMRLAFEEKLKRVGQVKKGDVLLLECERGRVFVSSVEFICNEGKENEEIGINKRQNFYFTVPMLVAGKSWVKKASILKGVKWRSKFCKEIQEIEFDD